MNTEEREQTLAVWLRDHGGILHKVARSFTLSPAEHDELVQDIRLALWQALPDFDRNSKPSTYIYRIALNRALSWKRRLRAYRAKLERLDNEPASAAAVTTPDPRLELIYAEIRRLDGIERSLILLQLDGFTYEEIGGTLGLTPTNVGARLTRVRQKLAHNLKDK